MISVYKDFDNPPIDLLGDTPKITDAVKQALYDLYHGKCAYTEEKIPFEEMEILHYRPVSLYPKLEFEWSNLLPVCKDVIVSLAEKFPINDKKVDFKLLKDAENCRADSLVLLAEKPVLLHPEVDTPENHLYFTRPSLDYFQARNKRSWKTIDLVSLNTESLAEKRQQTIEDLTTTLTSLTRQFRDGTLSDNLEKFIYSLNDNTTEFHKLKQHFLLYVHDNFMDILLYKRAETYNFYLENQQKRQQFRKLLNRIESTPNFIFKDNSIEKLSTEDVPPFSTPFVIKHFKIQRKNPIKSLVIQNIPINTKWIFLTGENGFGKTLVLQSIVQALWLYTPNSGYPEGNIRLELYYPSQQKTTHQRNDDVYLPKQYNWCAYGANRLDISGYISGDTQAPQKLNKTDSLFKNYGVLSNIEEYLINMHGKSQFEQRSEQIKTLLIKLLPNIDNITINDSQLKSKVFYQEKAADDSLMSPVSFGQLSAGSKSIIAMIGDMVIDLLEYQEVEQLSDLYGIVLIDEIDAHLHPKWQKEFVRLLTELFPKIQFIASTHSPIPLLGAPRETIILNVNKPSKKEGVTVQKLDIDVTQLTPNTILSSPIFGFETLDSVESKRRVYTQNSYDDLRFEKELKNRLRSLADDDDLSKYIIDDSKND